MSKSKEGKKIKDLFSAGMEKAVADIREYISHNPRQKQHIAGWGIFEGLADLNGEDIEARVREVIGCMTLEQKVGQMSGDMAIEELLAGTGFF